MAKPFNGNYSITGNFGATGGAYGYAVHQGVDFGLPLNTPVLAANGGKVVRVGNVIDAGRYIVIAIGAREELYFHLNKQAVAVGQVVATGQVIGYSGSTGNSTGPHLHFEVRQGGRAIDPTPFWNTPTPRPQPVVQHGAGWYRALRPANVRAGASTAAQEFPARRLYTGHQFQAVRAVEGEMVNQNSVRSNIWIVSVKNGFVWSGNLVKIS